MSLANSIFNRPATEKGILDNFFKKLIIEILANLPHFFKIMGKFCKLLKDNRVTGSEPKVLTLLV